MPGSKTNPLADWLVTEWHCRTIDVRVISFHPVGPVPKRRSAAVYKYIVQCTLHTEIKMECTYIHINKHSQNKSMHRVITTYADRTQHLSFSEPARPKHGSPKEEYLRNRVRNRVRKSRRGRGTARRKRGSSSTLVPAEGASPTRTRHYVCTLA